MPFEYDRSELTREGVLGFLMPPPPSFPPPSDNLCDEAFGVVGELPLELGRAFGGCGKAPTLMVFRKGRWTPGAGEGAFEPAGVLATLDTEPLCFGLGRPMDLGVGKPEDTLLDGVTAGAASCDAPKECLGVDGVLMEPFRVLDTGRAGSGAFGGPSEGRDGRGNVVVMLLAEDMQTGVPTGAAGSPPLQQKQVESLLSSGDRRTVVLQKHQCKTRLG